VQGLQACGEDKVWHWAAGKITSANTIIVTCPATANPIAVRYAWSDNPVCNLYTDRYALLVAPFRTDDFPLVIPTAAAKK
jgi:sialate O-acetylesterase